MDEFNGFKNKMNDMISDLSVKMDDLGTSSQQYTKD